MQTLDTKQDSKKQYQILYNYDTWCTAAKYKKGPKEPNKDLKKDFITKNRPKNKDHELKS